MPAVPSRPDSARSCSSCSARFAPSHNALHSPGRRLFCPACSRPPPQRRLSRRLSRPAETKKCWSCKESAYASKFVTTDGRCTTCYLAPSLRCSKCKTSRERPLFEKPSRPGQTPVLLKTCMPCRSTQIQAGARRKAAAVDDATVSGHKWCSGCRKSLAPQSFLTNTGAIRSTCETCRSRRRATVEDTPDEDDDQPAAMLDEDDTDETRIHDIDPNLRGNAGTPPNFPSGDAALPPDQLQLIADFLKAEGELKLETCSSCNEMDFNMRIKDGQCQSCHQDKETPKKYSLANKASPCLELPLALQNLTELEEMMISPVLPIMQVRYTKGRQNVYKEHVCNFTQNIENVADVLPRMPEDCEILILRRDGTDLTTHIDFVVRAGKVRDALAYKIANDPNFSQYSLNNPETRRRLALFPSSGTMVDRIPTIRVRDVDPDIGTATGPAQAVDERTGIDDEDEQEVSGVLDLGQDGTTEVDTIRQRATDAVCGQRHVYEREYVATAPTVDSTPIAENTPAYITRAFPTLFPDGSGDYHQPRHRKLGLAEYFKHLMRFQDCRFARHRRFPWFAFNTVQRSRVRSQAKVYVKQTPEADGLTNEDIQAMLDDGDVSLANNMMRYGDQLRGTRAYWSSRRAELMDAIHSLGTPHAFLTLSAADLQWSGLHDHMPGGRSDLDENDPAARRKRRDDLNRHPHIAATYLELRVGLFIKHVICPLLNVEHFWYRYEWQARGSGHIHGLLWLRNAPNPDDIDWKSLKEHDAVVSDEQEEKMKQFVDFWDKIITAVNPYPREDPNTPLTGQHPSSMRPESLQYTRSELADLLNWVERHKVCRPEYCQVKRKVPGSTEKVAVCRFDYPHPVRNSSGCGLDSKTRPRFEPQRNDPLLNAYNPAIMMGWRANTDLKPILSKSAAIDYIAKYATKAEANAPDFPRLLSSIVQASSDRVVSSQTICQKLLNKMLGERSYSAQESAHILLGLPLVHATFSYQTVNLCKDGSMRPLLSEDTPTDGRQILTGESWFQRYTKRPDDMTSLSMHEVAEKFSWGKGKWSRRRQKTKVIVRAFPRLSPDPAGDKYEDYCRYKILLHHSFRSLDQFLPPHACEHDWIQLYATCMANHTHHPADTFREYRPPRESLDDSPEEDDDEYLQPDLDSTFLREQDWQLYQRLHPHASLPAFTDDDLGARPIDNAWNIQEAWDHWDDLELTASYLADQRAQRGFNHTANSDEAPVDITTLKDEQKKIFDRYIKTFTDTINGTPVNQMLLNIDGTAGCGKTYLIRAICQELRRLAEKHDLPDPIRVIAPSGVAALNILGRTIHSALSIPASNSGGLDKLAGTRLNHLQEQWKGVHFVIVDEKSMLGQRMFAKMDARLRQVRPSTLSDIFGGFHFSIIGDFAQLPPVKDRALYATPADHNTDMGQLSRDGHALYLALRDTFCLTVVHRQQGNSPEQHAFRSLLHNTSLGRLSEPQWQALTTRCVMNLSASERKPFEDAVSLFTTSEVVRAANLTELVALGRPVAKITALHEGGADAKKLKTDEAGGLECEIVLSKGAKVMLTRNIWQDEGLVNGTMATVEDIAWQQGADRSDLPLAVLVSCKTYTGPTLWRTEPREGFPDGIPVVPIPVIKTTADVKGKFLARTQIPLRLAWAVTVHKSQGLTLEKARIGLGDKEFCTGLTFVALSRVKAMTDIMLVENLDYSRVKNLGGAPLVERLKDLARRYPHVPF